MLLLISRHKIYIEFLIRKRKSYLYHKKSRLKRHDISIFSLLSFKYHRKETYFIFKKVCDRLNCPSFTKIIIFLQLNLMFLFWWERIFKSNNSENNLFNIISLLLAKILFCKIIKKFVLESSFVTLLLDIIVTLHNYDVVKKNVEKCFCHSVIFTRKILFCKKY